VEEGGRRKDEEKEEGGRTEEEKEEGGRGGGLGRGRGSGRKGVACGRRRTTETKLCWTTARTAERLERWEIIGRAAHQRRRGEGKQRGGLEMAYAAARHGHDTQRAYDTDTRTRRARDKGGQNQRP